MRQLTSSLTGRQGVFDPWREALRAENFNLANWDYDYGYFDRQLDEKATVFLRLPIEVVEGQLDDADAIVRVGVPFVLKHLYQTGNDPDIGYASGPVAAAMVNQFQEPSDKDAPVEDGYIDRAESILRTVEQRLV